MEKKQFLFVHANTKVCPHCDSAFEKFTLPNERTCFQPVKDRTRGHSMLRCSNNHQFSQCSWDSCGDNFWEWEVKTKTFLHVKTKEQPVSEVKTQNPI